MAREHPQGAARHVGAQVRYLILSRHGCLGAFGVAASALMLAARDRWIGWDPALRAQQLHRVVAMSRFLIRPGVRCHNLASKVLGMCLRRLADDFARRYGYSPLLVETFVDSRCHAGTSLKASNWILVGETCGRGRFAPAGVQVPVKSIYMYPLQPAWREQLGLATREPIPALGPGEGLDRAQWADILFSDIEIIALEDFAKDRKLPPPDNLGRAVLTMAMLGGYLNRKRDSPPGHAKPWEGYTRLTTTAQTYERLLRLDRTSDFYRRLRSDKTCG